MPVLADYDYTYDLADRLIQELHHGQSSGYGYDDLGQLTSATHSGQQDEGYDYDAAGNRTGAGLVVGPNNRILADDEFDYAYDNEGNLVTKTERATGEATTYTYDHLNRITRIQRHSAGGILLSEASYTYDVFSRRIAKIVDADGAGPQAAETTRFVSDGENVWADLDASGAVIARYLGVRRRPCYDQRRPTTLGKNEYQRHPNAARHL